MLPKLSSTFSITKMKELNLTLRTVLVYFLETVMYLIMFLYVLKTLL